MPEGNGSRPPSDTLSLARVHLLAGAALALAGVPFSLRAGLSKSLPFLEESSLALAIAVALLLVGAALAAPRGRRIGRALLGLAFCTLSAYAAPHWLKEPALALFDGVLLTAALSILLTAKDAKSASLPSSVRAALMARGAMVTALVITLQAAIADALPSSPDAIFGVHATRAVAAVALGTFFVLDRKVHWGLKLAAALGWAGACAVMVAKGGEARATMGAFGAAEALSLVPLAARAPSVLSVADAILAAPERVLVSTFAVLCALGTLALALPPSSASSDPISLVDAAFTAISAVCVTGLIVVDTPSAFSSLGQGILLLLIQVGGLGIMSFSTAALHLLGRRLGLRHEATAAGLMNARDRSQLRETARRILLVTFTAEGLGALALSVAFLSAGEGLGEAIWRGVFTSVSAFCNSGFALQTESLIPYADRPFILHCVATLIILGGLSPAVVLTLPRAGSAKPRGLGAQPWLVLTSTACLLLFGFVAFAALEWETSLAAFSPVDRLHHAWFQSVTTRTAGFNSIPIEELNAATLSIMEALMFVGGSPGGTAGGIKTTTVAVLFLAALAAMSGHHEVEVKGRKIPHASVYRAAAIFTVALGGVFVALLALQLTQEMATEVAFFEVISALGTVGLTTGGTAQLDAVGKIIIMACMFVGRIGTLTLFIFLSQRDRKRPWGLPEETIDVG